MTKFIKKILFFIVPLVLFLLILVAIDPYNQFNIITIDKFSELKKAISYPVNRPLVKVINFNKNPADLIILGDSRGNSLPKEKFLELSGLSSSNLSIGGGTLPEAIEMFWFAMKQHDVRQVFFAINFNLYDGDNSMNRVSEAIELSESNLKLLLSKYSIKAAIKILSSFLKNGSKPILSPQKDKEEFWKYQLESSAKGFYMNYEYPQPYFEQLKEISEYCNNNQKQLTFIIPPTHTDLQNRIVDFGLENANAKFINDLASLGVVYNFDIESDLTNNKDNFGDPFHFNAKTAEIVIEEVISGNPYYSKVL